jgi:Stress responsive A/B Barrel Domain
VIRHAALLRFKDGTPAEDVEAVAAALRGVATGGLLALTVGRDAGLREGNAGLAIVADFADEAAYRAYDEDAEHNRIRRELLAPILDRAERCQFRV